MIILYERSNLAVNRGSVKAHHEKLAHLPNRIVSRPLLAKYCNMRPLPVQVVPYGGQCPVLWGHDGPARGIASSQQ